MRENSSEIKFAVALSQFSKFGPVRFDRLLKYFGSHEAAFRGNLDGMKSAGIEEKIAQEFIAMRLSLEPDKLSESMAKEGVAAIIKTEPSYPAHLKEIYDAPALLYYKGTLPTNNELMLAVVGARKFSPYGRQLTDTIVKELAENNLTIVSGLALGIDALAHQAALEVGGRTIAVLGTGLDKANIYPSSNRWLADKILSEGGLLLSEYPLGTAPLRFNFPQRNRIISGLSLGTLVIEANIKSGSLITAKTALDQNREVFAVPGNVFSPLSSGTNWLIKQGATAVTEAADITAALDLSLLTNYSKKDKQLNLTPAEGQLLPFLSQEAKHINELVRISNSSAAQVASTLTMLEIKGLAKNMGNMMYVLTR